MIRHAGLVARRLEGRWRGVLIEGPSGSGKSDLALRALADGFRLVADDRVVVWASGGALYGRAPAPLAGLIEARGQGVVAEPALPMAQIMLVAACQTAPEAIERVPDPSSVVIAGIAVPWLEIDARGFSAPARLRRALEWLGVAHRQVYQASPLGDPRGRAGTGDSR